MSKNDLIEIGDLVTVITTTSTVYPGHIVLYVPQATGDAWHIKNPRTGEVIYVQTYSEIRLVKKLSQ